MDSFAKAVVVLSCCVAAQCASAQTTVTTPGGTSGTVPVFTGSAAVGNSSITSTGGKVGIGTSTPNAPLNIVSGTVSIPSQVYNALVVQPAGGTAQYANGSSILFDSVTNSGIEPIGGIWSSLWSGGNGGYTYNGALVLGTTRAGSPGPVEAMRVDEFGNVGIGTTNPSARLEVNGNATIDGSVTFSDNSTQLTAWTGVLCGGDYAESVNVSDSRTQYEPGDVLVVDPNAEGRFLKSVEPYSTLVTGIFSTKPGVVGRRQTTDKSQMKDEVPMAMVGIVPTKVSAENGPIKPGDLLVTSSTPGYSMKGNDRSQMLGAVIGKALGHLDAGRGMIEVAVSLQ